MSFFDKFRRRGPYVRDECAEIVSNVSRILATKRGFGALDERLGISDLSASNSRAYISEMLQKEITENLSLYERRVKIARLTESGGPTTLRLRFELTCSVSEGEQSLYLIYNYEENRFSFEHPKKESPDSN
jgi:predicted component of type VI protein secretion system